MTRVEIPFNEWSQGRLEAGEKTATCRTKRYGVPGDVFAAADRVYQLTHVVELPLSVVATNFHRQEGCESFEEFVEVWTNIHPVLGYDPDWMVYLHLFTDGVRHDS